MNRKNYFGFFYYNTLKNKEWLYDHYVDHDIFVMTSEKWKPVDKFDYEKALKEITPK